MALVGTISGSNGTMVSAVTGSLIIADRPSSDFPSKQSDVILFVSGVAGGRGTVGGGVGLFGGDLVTSGSAFVLGDLAVNGGDITTTATTFDLLNSTATTVNFAGGATSALRIGNSSGINAISGSTGFPQGLSGSLTKLTDGTNYLIAGTNISTSTGSNGAVTISVTGITPGVTSLTGDVTGMGPGATATTISTTGINRTNDLGLTNITAPTAPTAAQLADIPAFRCTGSFAGSAFTLVAPSGASGTQDGRRVTFINATGNALTIRNIGSISSRTMSNFGGSTWVYSTGSVNWFCTSNV